LSINYKGGLTHYFFCIFFVIFFRKALAFNEKLLPYNAQSSSSGSSLNLLKFTSGGDPAEKREKKQLSALTFLRVVYIE